MARSGPPLRLYRPLLRCATSEAGDRHYHVPLVTARPSHVTPRAPPVDARLPAQSEDGQWAFRLATTEAEPSSRRTCSNGSSVRCTKPKQRSPGYQEMLAIAQRQGMTYEQQWMPGQIARLQVTVNEIVVLWPEAVEFEAKRRREHCNDPRHQPWCEGCVTR
jgi:hypothetical protein